MRSVIIVDDSPTIVRLLQAKVNNRLKILGTANDGQAGVDLYKKQKPDLVLLDITMPNKSGKECLKEILDDNPEAKVVMVSSVSDSQNVEECLRMGAKAFVRKDQLRASDIGVNCALLNTIDEVLAA